jgi:hypothetical protein
MTELLFGTSLDVEQREYVNAIRESGKLLLTVRCTSLRLP